MAKSARKKSVSNAYRRKHSILRRGVMAALRKIKAQNTVYDQEDPYAGFLESFPMVYLVESADRMIARYPRSSVSQILELIEDDFMPTEEH